MHDTQTLRFRTLLTFLILLPLPLQAQQGRALTFQDIMKFKAIETPSLSDDGLWVAYATQPDRGDGEAVIRSTQSGTVYTIERGGRATFSTDARWVAVIVKPKAADLEGKTEEKDKPKQGLVLLNIASGDTLQWAGVDRVAFSGDSRWLAYLSFQPEEKTDSCAKPAAVKAAAERKKNTGAELILRRLSPVHERKIPFVLSFAFDSLSHVLVYAVGDSTGKRNGLYYMNLQEDSLRERTISSTEKGTYTHLIWDGRRGRLAFVAATLDSKGNPGPAGVWVWDPATGKGNEVIPTARASHGWMVPSKNDLTWSKDGDRLFFGVRPPDDTASAKTDTTSKAKQVDLFDEAALLKKKEVDVWHWKDPRIISNQKKRWKDAKDQLFRAVYDVGSDRIIQLGDSTVPFVQASDNPFWALGRTDWPYLKESTWQGDFFDSYVLSLRDGSRRKIADRLRRPAELSPEGSSVVFYKNRNWILVDVQSGKSVDLTSRLAIPFSDEDADTPEEPSSYGIAGWMSGDRGVMIYDKYDIWLFATRGGEASCITGGEGRRKGITYRIVKLNPEKKSFDPGERILLTAYNDRLKYTDVASAVVGKPGVENVYESHRNVTFLAKAKNADRYLFTRETYNEFPDLWVTKADFHSPTKISDVNPQVGQFAWGEAELVEWNSLDGKPLQGVLIRPGNYEAGKRYPVLVYFYELSSQRLYDFNQVVISHRPCFPFYASNGYAVFLPDVRFDVGQPGLSAVKCIVPGVQKLIDMGIADPKAIGIHGHSWGGYETAYMVTQTRMFAAAVAGAPVGNMTSAYSGIRLESGLARQFQYEKNQSRIGASLWERRDLYIENSPVFFADRVSTPLLIEFGDEDDAVPWQQGVEIYLAMRRLGKDCILLEYRNEPHHLKKYPNKLDYSIKMKEYFDHYLKGMPAPKWISAGVPYHE